MVIWIHVLYDHIWILVKTNILNVQTGSPAFGLSLYVLFTIEELLVKFTVYINCGLLPLILN